MAKQVLVLGDSGAGKSTALEHLDPKTTFILNVTGKPLPIRGWKKLYSKEKLNYHVTSNHQEIIESLKTIQSDPRFAHIHQVVIDDFQYVMSFEFMKRAKEVGYNKFTEMAQHVFQIIEYSRHMRDDLTVFILSHSDTQRNDAGQIYTRMKTIGKLLDEKITLEGLFTIVLIAQVDPTSKGDLKYHFLTQNDGTSTAKSPRGMFEELRIPNDLSLVVDKIYEYNK